MNLTETVSCSCRCLAVKSRSLLPGGGSAGRGPLPLKLHAERKQSLTSGFCDRPGPEQRRSSEQQLQPPDIWWINGVIGDSSLEEMRRPLLPLLVGLSPALLFLLLPGSAAAVQEESWEDYKDGHQAPPEPKCTWECVLFTLQWPGGFCLSLNNESLCRIPESINNWTIHGLWPVKAHTCCNCWPMFHSDVQELEEELDQYWPSLLKTKSRFQFWKEEWRKHGACAACVEGFNSPLKYFQICLKLRHHFDIQRLLEDAGITPSCERLYKVGEWSSVLDPHLGNKTEVQCVTDDQEREVLFQVKVPLSRNLTVGCDHHGNADGGPGLGPGWSYSSGHPCPPGVPFFYFPVNHQQPRRPCG